MPLAFTVTDVDFETTRSPERITQLTRIIRALAHPDIIEYDQDEVDIEVPFYLPCPEGGAPEIVVDQSGPYLVVDPTLRGPKRLHHHQRLQLRTRDKGTGEFLPPSGASLTDRQY